MKRHLTLLIALPAAVLVWGASAAADSWIFLPSTYSHDPATGERVDQFTPEKQSFAREDDTYMESGYRHLHTSILGPDGAYDQMHVVQTWGAGDLIRPYGEWERPFRAGATPFGPWGNPQGPWTTPFQSWQNPYGLGKLPNPPWAYPSYGSGASPGPMPYGPSPSPPTPYGPLTLPPPPTPHP